MMMMMMMMKMIMVIMIIDLVMIVLILRKPTSIYLTSTFRSLLQVHASCLY